MPSPTSQTVSSRFLVPRPRVNPKESHCTPDFNVNTCPLLGLIFRTRTGAGGIPIIGPLPGSRKKTVRAGRDQVTPPRAEARLGLESRPGPRPAGRDQVVGDALRLPTVRLLTDSLESCSRAAGTATLPPSMPGGPPCCAPWPPRYRGITSSSGPATADIREIASS